MDDRMPELLYHYTDGYALASIVSSGCLWASDPLFLNDSRELVSGQERLLEYIERPRQSGSRIERIFDQLSKGLKALAYDVVDSVDRFVPGQLHVYVTCFCENGDLLSQWRSYGSGGYAIGFDRTKLSEHVQFPKAPQIKEGQILDWLPSSLVRVVYDVTDIAKHVDGINLYRHSKHSQWMAENHSAIRALEALASIKDAGFREEREWRLTFVRPPKLKDCEVKFRQGASSLVPYIELQVPDGAVREIVVGPGDNREVQVMAVQRLLEEKGLDAKVKLSGVPYRGV